MTDTTKTDVASHRRVNQTLLGVLERPALDWLVRRVPAWLTPDHLTVLGLLGALLIGISYYLTSFSPAFLWLASLGFILNWLGDSLDGNLARFRRIERPRYGFFIDHTIDGLAEVCICVGLGLSPYFSFSFAMLALVGYLLVSSFVFINTYVSAEFRISYGKFGPTEVRASAILVNAIIFVIGNPRITLGPSSFLLFDTVLIAFSVVFFGGYVLLVIKRAVELNREESGPAAVSRKSRRVVARARFTQVSD